MRGVLLILLSSIVISGCLNENSPVDSAVENPTCKGIYYTRSTTGELLKYSERYLPMSNQCVAFPMHITNWEMSKDIQSRKGIRCSPQSDLPSMSLKASGNFYTYRDNRLFIDLNSETGIYRILVRGEYIDGREVIERSMGCYYLRTDQETEPVNPRDYGSMIMFGQKGAATSSPTLIDEIFNYTDTGTGMELVDPTPEYRGDWNAAFCPFLSVPWGFCDLLRNGNIRFDPKLTSAENAAMTNEALLIRAHMSFDKILLDEFNTLWDFYEENADHQYYAESIVDEYYTNSWKYRVKFRTDPSPYTYDAWIAYIRKDRPKMPDLTSP